MAAGAVEADYLVIGAGLAGMAFTDALIAESDASVLMVERHTHRAGTGTTPVPADGRRDGHVAAWAEG